MKKGLSRLLLVMIAIAMIVSTIPAYEPYAEQGGARAEETVEGTPEQSTVVEGQTNGEQPVEQEVPPAETTVEGVPEQPEVVEEKQETQVPTVKEDGDWVDPYYEGKRMLRGVQDKPEKATIKTVSNGVGTGTGAMNLSWKAMPGATGYKVIIGNGYNYEHFSVGNVTSWTTKGKGIFPTKAELDKGLYRFHTDGKGTEFANDPTQLYENTFKAGTTWTLRGQKKYIVRILAIYTSGDGPTSDITEAVMPPETLPAKPEKSAIKTVSSGAGTGTGYMDISWKAVSGAIDYKVVISNGYNYEYFNTGNVTNWSTKGKKIFPTQAEITNKQYKFHQDGKGVEFASDPRALYENGYQAGSTFGLRNQKKYIVRILAVYPWGDGPTSDITDATMPIEQMSKPAVTSHRSESDENVGYLNISWQPVADAVSYKIGLFNGYNYDYINVGNVVNWSTKGKKLWSTADEIVNGRYQLHMDGSIGAELPMDPMQTYTAANKVNPNVNYSDRLFYYTRVIAVFENNESPVSDASTVTMPHQSITDVDLSPRGLDEEIGAIDLYWNEVAGAKGYKVWIFNGANYESFDVGNATEWTSQYQNIWPTAEDIKRGKGALHSDSSGAELTLKPSEVYALNGSNYSDKDMYWSKITAYGQDGQTIAMNQNETVEIEALPNDVESQKEMDQINDILQEYLSRSEETGVQFNVDKALQNNLDEQYIEIGELINDFNEQTGPVEDNPMVKAIRVPVWGNWCGPGYGGGKPKDKLDAGCKAHDLCYGKRGYFACSCDRDLQKHIRNNTKYMKAKEKTAAIAIGMWFRNAPCNVFR
ncbi:hypothetical protein HCB37_05060 [Listeria booriae]|uniref:hypothetical protein n=1 Tax=Listeria booriae TaxID=1552123 RepID=UPI0016267B54|nr:hypothetical protein [Listeria booriae]MBC1973736.1 hypothetical protein [Listeria booriae]MBC2031444.1 hypothetical protein [Listeria booriae]MBC2263884.1 hypothetical protein [Listeria booriae]